MKKTLRILTATILLIAGVLSTYSQTTLLISLPALADKSDGIACDLIIRLEIGIEDSWFNNEENQSLEDWMLGDISYELHDTWAFLKVDIEAPLKLEEWMICKEPWCKMKQKTIFPSVSVL